MIRRVFVVPAFLFLAFAALPELYAAAEGGTAPSYSCSVSCKTDFFACCNSSACFCVENGPPIPCQSGGVGSTSCSTGKQVQVGGLLEHQQAYLDQFLERLEDHPVLDDGQQSALQEFLASLNEEEFSCSD